MFIWYYYLCAIVYVSVTGVATYDAIIKFDSINICYQ